ncbi:uncharacterized protein LOC135626502 [Musa acuminata AAA Group]|uniref:uncharacterized protein LOC103971641 n=1 Tax=Musa acuminata AAA Group TaxID=214697 RepID=UPI0031D0C635
MVEGRRASILTHPFAALILMVLASFFPVATTANRQRHQHSHPDVQHERRKMTTKKKKKKPPPSPPTETQLPPSSSSSWEQFKGLLSCRITAASRVHDPASTAGKLGRAACGPSICALRDVVVHRSDSDPNSDAGSTSQRETAPLAPAVRPARHLPPPVSSLGCGSYYSRGGMQLPKLAGCYECHAVSIDPSSRRYPRPRTTLCSCSECGEVFTKPETLELHQAVRHAVSELGAEDSARNVVEIIFKSSWQKKDRPICKIERILKVHNAPSAVAPFEDYRAAVKFRRRHHPSRCAADGNELLRFHCTSLACALGARGSTSLCSGPSSSAPCGVCTIIRHGFGGAHHPRGVRTTASSGRAHDASGGGERRAMLVCRVIAGRVQRPCDEEEDEDEDAYDSVAVGYSGGNLEELLVANPTAILPCFVVIYRALLD